MCVCIIEHAGPYVKIDDEAKRQSLYEFYLVAINSRDIQLITLVFFFWSRLSDKNLFYQRIHRFSPRDSFVFFCSIWKIVYKLWVRLTANHPKLRYLFSAYRPHLIVITKCVYFRSRRNKDRKHCFATQKRLIFTIVEFPACLFGTKKNGESMFTIWNGRSNGWSHKVIFKNKCVMNNSVYTLWIIINYFTFLFLLNENKREKEWF